MPFLQNAVFDRTIMPTVFMTNPLTVAFHGIVVFTLFVGCNAQPSVPATNSSEHRIQESAGASAKRLEWVDDFGQHIEIFETVFWEPADTESLRQLIRETELVKDKSVLEIGTGSGLVSLYCLRAGASSVVATDINPSAAANAIHNAKRLGLDLNRFTVRVVPRGDSGAFAVMASDERFDLIVSNPPWEDAEPQTIDQYALYDENFALLRSLLDGLRARLNPGGRALLAYGCVTAVRTLLRVAPEYGLEVRILDDRHINDLPELFLPGMLLEVRPSRSLPSDENVDSN